MGDRADHRHLRRACLSGGASTGAGDPRRRLPPTSETRRDLIYRAGFARCVGAAVSVETGNVSRTTEPDFLDELVFDPWETVDRGRRSSRWISRGRCRSCR
jgi:hypothetical protein